MAIRRERRSGGAFRGLLFLIELFRGMGLGSVLCPYGFPPSQLYGSTITTTDSTFTNNKAISASGSVYGVGGAVDLEFGVVATISNSTLAGNVATGGAGCDANGGAIFPPR